MRPDERIFREHLTRGAFRQGEIRGKWEVLRIAWPKAIFCVSAASRPGAPDRYALQFDLAGYPQAAPTARLWNADADASLAPNNYPTGPSGSRVERAFRSDWHNGEALYLPCDRRSINGHPAWRTQHPNLLWSPDRDITFFLEIVHDLLHSSTYTGVRRP